MKHLITTLCTVLLCGYILVASGTSQEVQPTYLVSDVTLYPALIEELTLTTRVLASQCNETVEKSESVSVGTPAWSELRRSLPSCQRLVTFETKLKRAEDEFQARLCVQRSAVQKRIAGQ